MTTHRLIPSAVVCVPQSQRADYAKAAGASRVLTHPDSVRGLTPKLNWIFDHVRDREAIVFVDDDITSLQRCFTEPGEEATIRDPRLIEEIIRATFILARDRLRVFFRLGSQQRRTPLLHRPQTGHARRLHKRLRHGIPQRARPALRRTHRGKERLRHRDGERTPTPPHGEELPVHVLPKRDVQRRNAITPACRRSCSIFRSNWPSGGIFSTIAFFR